MKTQNSYCRLQALLFCFKINNAIYLSKQCVLYYIRNSFLNKHFYIQVLFNYKLYIVGRCLFQLLGSHQTPGYLVCLVTCQNYYFINILHFINFAVVCAVHLEHRVTYCIIKLRSKLYRLQKALTVISFFFFKYTPLQIAI